MTKPPLILFTGGGSMGHVFPSIAVAQALQSSRPDIQIVFITSERTNECHAITSRGFVVRPIHAPKFPRGISFRLIVFPLLFPLALLESLFILLSRRPAIIFSKGGFVSVPVCIIAFVLRIPIVLHESDSVMGLGNRFIARLSQTVCTGFPLTIHHPTVMRTGNPVRPFLTGGSKEEGMHITGFSCERPVLLITGGSQGARAINEAVAKQLDDLLHIADVIHLTGEGKSGAPLTDAHYWVRPYVTDELPHLYALADLVITRAGAGTLAELAFVKKPAIVIPLEGVAHNHQVHNAEMLWKHDAIDMLLQQDLSGLTDHVASLLKNAQKRQTLQEKLHKAFPQNAAVHTAQVLLDALAKDC